MTEKISVIIPVYNVEKQIQTCLDSVLGQTYQNLKSFSSTMGQQIIVIRFVVDMLLRTHVFFILKRITVDFQMPVILVSAKLRVTM